MEVILATLHLNPAHTLSNICLNNNKSNNKIKMNCRNNKKATTIFGLRFSRDLSRDKVSIFVNLP